MDTVFLLIGIGVVIGFAAGMLYGYERGREDTMRVHNITRFREFPKEGDRSAER
jgi:gas vesicle protein